MSKKTFFTVSGAVFLLIALFHLLRIIQEWRVTLDGSVVPFWISWVAVIAGLYLAYQGLKHRRS